jgi:hypothetical protein
VYECMLFLDEEEEEGDRTKTRIKERNTHII